MDYQEFCQYICEHMKDYLPEEKQKLDFQMMEVVKKNQGKMNGMRVIDEENKIAPIIYLQPSYVKYTLGVPLEPLLQEIAATYLKAAEETVRINRDKLEEFFPDMDTFDKQHVLESVIPSLLRPDMNQGLLQEIPHRSFHNLEIVYQILVHEDEKITQTVSVTNSYLKYSGIKEEEMYQAALKNFADMFPYQLHSMEFMLQKLLGIENREDILGKGIDCLGNDAGMYGATYLIMPEVMKEVGDRLGGSFVVIPTSIHEMAVIKEGLPIDYEKVVELVQRSNQEALPMDEMLSDTVFFYDRNSEKLLPVRDNGQDLRLK